jgi:CIC family chloride channel protein
MKVTQIWQIKVLRKLNKFNLDEDTIFFVLTLVVGVLAGVIAVGLHHLITFITHALGTDQTFTLSTTWKAGLLVLISGIITTRFYPSTSGSGIPQVKLALVVHHGKITFFQTLAKFVTSVLALGSGLSLGREGPTVTISAGIGSSLGNFFSLSKRKVKALVAVGSAGALAGAFNTPIAAVVFTLEEIVGDLNTKMLGSIIISSVVASFTTAMLHGSDPLFSKLHYQMQSPFEFVIYLTIGVAAAFLGPLFVKTVLTLRSVESKIFKQHKLTVIMLGFAIVAGASLINPSLLGSGHSIITQTLLSKITDPSILLPLLIFKFILTAVCYSTGVSGGLFFPTLFIGAMLGALIGSSYELLFSHLTSPIGAYALIGMGAFFASVIRAPFTSIIMIFEMTQDYNIMLPLMVANITSYLISHKVSSGSIYERISEQDGVHLPNRDDDEALEELTVENAMVRDVKSLNANLEIKEALTLVGRSEISGYPIIKNGNLYGVISTSELASAYAKFQGNCYLENICNKEVISIYPDQSLLIALKKLKENKISRLIVVSRINDRRIVGLITAEDIVNHYGFHIEEESKGDVLDKYITEIEQQKTEPTTQE